jgi:hypothetical protein
MIDLSRERPITLNAARRLPELSRDGRRPDIASLYRWTGKGLRGIRLESVQIGGSRCTSVEAVRRFINALTLREVGPAAVSENTYDAEQAEKELAAQWRGGTSFSVQRALNGNVLPTTSD